MIFVAENQLLLLLLFFLAGCFGTALIFRQPADARAW